MANIIINLWFIVLFIPGVYFVYINLQCFDYDKLLKKGKTKEFKIIYFLVCVIISFLFSFAFTTLIEKIYEIASGITNL